MSVGYGFVKWCGKGCGVGVRGEDPQTRRPADPQTRRPAVSREDPQDRGV